MTTASMSLHEKPTTVDMGDKPLICDNYFLIRVEKCFDCPHFKNNDSDTDIELYTCKTCIKDVLGGIAGIVTSIKPFDHNKYEITVHKKTPEKTEDSTPDTQVSFPLNESFFKQFSSPSAAKQYCKWILDQIQSGNQQLLKQAIDADLFSKEIKDDYITKVFNELVAQHIIKFTKRDGYNKEYHLVAEQDECIEGKQTEVQNKETENKQGMVEIPISNETETSDDDSEDDEIQQRIKKYERWIIDQIYSENHDILQKAKNDRYFAKGVWERFGQPALQNLLDQYIIELDKKTGNYRQIAEYVNSDEDKAIESNDGPNYTHYVSYTTIGPHTPLQKIEKFTSLAEALEFVKTKELRNYLIDTLNK